MGLALKHQLRNHARDVDYSLQPEKGCRLLGRFSPCVASAQLQIASVYWSRRVFQCQRIASFGCAQSKRVQELMQT